MPADASDARRVAIGCCFILASGVIFAFMSALTKVVSDAGMSSMQIVFVSGTVRWLGLAALLLQAKQSPFGPPGIRVLLVVRSLCGCTAFSCATYAFGIMPIGDATTIFLTSPVWAAMLGRTVLKEKLHTLDLTAIFMAIIGVVLVARPTAIFGSSGSSAAAPSSAPDLSAAVVAVPPAYVVLIGAGFAGSVAVLVRLIKKRANPHPAVIAHAYAIITVLVAPVALLLLGQEFVVGSHLQRPTRTWALCILIGVLAIPNQLFVNAGLMRTPAALGSMMRLIDVPSAFVLQVVRRVGISMHLPPLPLPLPPVSKPTRRGFTCCCRSSASRSSRTSRASQAQR